MSTSPKSQTLISGENLAAGFLLIFLSIYLSIYHLFIYLFILKFEREGVCVCVHTREQQRSRERRAGESQAGSALSAQSRRWGANSGTESSWPELKSRVGCLIDCVTQVPQDFYLIDCVSFWEMLEVLSVCLSAFIQSGVNNNFLET